MSNISTKVSSAKPKIVSPRKMGSGRWWALPATLGVLGFYALSALAWLLIGVLLLLDLVAFIGLARFGMTGLITPGISALSSLLVVIARSFHLSRGEDYFLSLRRDDAPEMYAMMESLARRAGVSIPSEIVLEMTSGAWVQLRGYSHKSRSRLGVGYDLLAVLRPEELEAVLAHELAHAKLVQRGYRGWLLNGLARMGRQVEMMRALIAEVRPHKRHFYCAEILVRLVGALGKLVSRFAAEYSRRDEFAADRFGAELTSSAAAQRALLQTYLSDAGYAFSWKERAAHIEREDGFADWLRAQLFPPDETVREERKQKALALKQSSEFDTHPPLAERLAALQNAAPIQNVQEPNEEKWASDLLAQPDKIAARLLQKIEVVSQREEEKHTKDAQRWARKNHRKSGSSVIALTLMVLSGGLGLVFLSAAFFSSFTWSDAATALAFCTGGMALGVVLYAQSKNYKAKLPLPIPTLADWDAAIKKRDTEAETRWLQAYQEDSPAENSSRRAAMKAAMDSQAPTGKKREAVAYWSEQSYGALSVCDYERAEIAADNCLQINPKNLEGQVAKAIAGAFAGRREVLETPLGTILYHTGMSSSMNWATAWALCLLGEWPGAEPYFLDALKGKPHGSTPGRSTLGALLALSQWSSNKTGEALGNVRRAVEVAPDDVRIRVLLLRLLLNNGRIKEAGEHLAWLQTRIPSDRDVLLSSVTWNALRDETQAAQTSAQKLLACDSSLETRLRLARTLDDGKLKAQAREIFQQINDEVFCPETLMALSYIEYEAKNYQAAKTMLLQALDITRPAYPDRGSQLNWFGTIMDGLSANESKIATADFSVENAPEETMICKAWDADLNVGNRLSKLGIHRLKMLLSFPDEAAAQQQAQVIANALCPHQEPAVTCNLTVAEKEYQPEEAVIPGIHGHGWL